MPFSRPKLAAVSDDELLEAIHEERKKTTWRLCKIEPAPVPCCPQCGGCRFLTLELPKETEVTNTPGSDTS